MRELSKQEHQTLTGLVMGDAHVNPGQKTPYIELGMKNRIFLEHLDEYFGDVTTGVRSEPNRNVWHLKTRSSVQFKRYRNWYSSGEKRFPQGLELTPRIAKYWYVCDGGLAYIQHKYPFASISAANEADRADYLYELFEENGFEPRIRGHRIQFLTTETDDFLEWLGDSVPGYEYKWEIESYDRYQKMMKGK